MPIAACSAACSEPGSATSSSSARSTARSLEGQPDRAGAQLAGRQVERELGEHLAGAQPAPLVGHHLVGHVDHAGVRGDRAQPAGCGRCETIERSVTSRATVVHSGLSGVHHRAGVVDVELVDDEGLAPVHVQRALVHRRVRGAAVDGAEQPAGRPPR